MGDRASLRRDARAHRIAVRRRRHRGRLGPRGGARGNRREVPVDARSIGLRVIAGLDHVQLAIPRGGEEAARAFYGGVLGLVEREKPMQLISNGGLWFES